jgi:hypothetical protein
LGSISSVSLGKKENVKSSKRKSKYLGNQIKEVLDAINGVHPFKERSAQ